MRDELSDRLVPALSGRTRSHEDFFWTMAFVQWSSVHPNDDDRVRDFLAWERRLKLVWARYQPNKSFAGSRRAKEQSEAAKPSAKFQPLLANQRSQGLLGAHLRPLRQLMLVKERELALTQYRETLMDGLAQAPRLGGTWESWKSAFGQVRGSYGVSFRKRLRQRMAEKMPELNAALSKLGWCETESWHLAAKHMLKHQRHALLAHEFCAWSRRVRQEFNAMIKDPKREVHLTPLKSSIPSDLRNWEPLKCMLERLNGETDHRQLLCSLHSSIFAVRGYSKEDCWVVWGKGGPEKTNVKPIESTSDGGDCRWSNAVVLMKPGS